jgi:hypothetical protein
MAKDALAQVADDLYSLTPDEFTSARNARAKELRGDDPQLAKRVQELRKPSPAAWVANALVRHRSDDIDEVLALGASLREAQADLDRDELATLTKQRRLLVNALAKQGAELAADLGHKVSATVTEELAQTLQAAMTDAAAADALRTGRLVRSLTAVGFDAVDLDGAVAGGPGAPPRRTQKPPPRDEAAEREHAKAKEAVRDAERKTRETAAELEQAGTRSQAAEKRRDDLEAEVAELEEQLRETKKELTLADRELRAVERDRDKAERADEQARAALAAAWARLGQPSD